MVEPLSHQDTKEMMRFAPLSEREESIAYKMIDAVETLHEGIILYS